MRFAMAAVVLFGALVGYAEARDRAADSAGGARSQRAAKDVVMYVMPGCGYCEAARKYFSERGVEWTERDVTASEAVNAEWKRNGGVGTPLILVDGERVTGFDRQALDALLKP